MLHPNANSIAAAQAGIEQQVEGEPLARTKRPTRLIAVQLFLRPRMEAIGIIRASEQLNALCRVKRHKLVLNRPAEKSAHRFEKVVCRMRRCGAALAPGADRLFCYVAQQRRARGLDHSPEDVLRLLSCRSRHAGPCRAFAIAVDRPGERVRLRRLRGQRHSLKRRAIFRPERLRAIVSLDSNARPVRAPYIPCNKTMAGFFSVQMGRAGARPLLLSPSPSA